MRTPRGTGGLTYPDRVARGAGAGAQARTRKVDARLRDLLDKADEARNGLRLEAGTFRPLGDKAKRTRQTVLDAALICFVQNGYVSTSVTDIHETAGVSLGTFYVYFRSKVDVMLTLVGEAISADAGHLLPRDDRGTGPVERNVEPFVRSYVASAGFQRVWEEATFVEPAIAEFRSAVTEIIVDDLCHRIELGQRDGTVNAGLDAAVTARALTAMVDRYCYLTFVVEAREDEAAVESVVIGLGDVWRAVLEPR